MPEYGDGSQCATIKARGATIAATEAWFAQNAAIAGVAVFAIAVSNKTAVGKYAAYFVTMESPCYDKHRYDKHSIDNHTCDCGVKNQKQ
jgi:hypothetical protein